MKLGVQFILFTKFFAFSCVAFMSAEAAFLPCHAETQINNSFCQSCVSSLEVWSEPWVKVQTPMTQASKSRCLSLFETEILLNDRALVLAEIRPPPPDFFLWRGEEIFQEQIKLRL